MADLEWFTGAGLGVFIHWDHSSQRGIEISWPLLDRSILPGTLDSEDRVGVEEYHATAATFDPVEFDAEAIARLAASAGARYLVFTARHHAGYAMWPSEVSDYSVRTSPTDGRDLVREVVEAVRAEGLRVGIYYSLPDWHHPDYPAFTEADKPYAFADYRRPDPEAWERYLGYVRAQLTELLTRYGDVDLLWFDGEWERTAEEWQAAALRELIADLQPATVVNDRLPGQGDYATPEQALPITVPPGPWELCLTMSESWAYRPGDTRWKTPRRLARHLADTVSRGGNLLLNIGPRGDGSLQPQEVQRLEALGEWLTVHGEALLGVEPGPATVDFPGPVTRGPGRIYLHLVAQPIESLVVRGLPVNRVRRVSLLATGAELAHESDLEVHSQDSRDLDAIGELTVAAPEPSGALLDVVVVELDE